jgi:hypothetical protein
MRPTCRYCMHYAPTSPGKGRCWWHDISTTPGRQCYLAPKPARDAFYLAGGNVVQGELERTAWAGRQAFVVPRPRYQLDPAPERVH